MMNSSVRCFMVVAALALAGLPALSLAQPGEVRNALPLARLGGQAKLAFWGFNVYDAKLWVQPGFMAGEYERHAFALELTYQRDFTNQAITKRSLDEMRRLPGATQSQMSSWQPLLRDAFPDVKAGDRITGIHRPGEGAMFITNGKTTGVISDAEFGRLFFGIWLSVHTSEPRMRDALLARVAPP